jgi:hypothetical protein
MEASFSPRTAQNTFIGTYATLLELRKEGERRCKPFLKSWNCHVSHHTAGLVGLLSTSACNGYWTLSDATQNVPCVFTGDIDDLVALHGTVVLLTKYTLVAEVCQVRDTRGKPDAASRNLSSATDPLSSFQMFLYSSLK